MKPALFALCECLTRLRRTLPKSCMSFGLGRSRSLASARAADPARRVTKSKPCIAVVDDEFPIRNSLRRLLLAADYDAVVFASGDEFLQSLTDQSPDCVLVDLNMPGLSGLDVVLRLKADWTDIAAIIMTGGGHADLERKFSTRARGSLGSHFSKTSSTLLLNRLSGRATAPYSHKTCRDRRPRFPQ